MSHLNPSGVIRSSNIAEDSYLDYLAEDTTPSSEIADGKTQVSADPTEERKNQELQEENQRLQKELKVLMQNYARLAQVIYSISSAPVQPKGLPSLDRPAEAIDNAQVLTNVQKWCGTMEQHLRKDAPLPTAASGVVIGDKSVVLEAFNLIARTFMEVIKIQEDLCLQKIPYREHSSLYKVRHNILTLVPISEKLRSDKIVMLTAILLSGGAFSMASKELRNDRDVALVAISSMPGAFSDASEQLRDDPDLARMAILGTPSDADYEKSQSFSIPGYDSPKLWQIRSPYLNRLYAKQLCSISAASDRIKDDRAFAFQVIQKNPLELEHVSKRLQDDKALVLEAVKMWGFPLKFASPRLQDDLDVVLAAVTAAANEASRNGDSRAFEFVSARLQKDPQVLAALAKGNEKVSDCLIS